MRDRFADSVHAIIRHGLSLRDRVEAGAAPSVSAEQATLADLLAPLATEEIWDAQEDDDLGFHFSDAGDHDRQAGLSQATIRYALTSWLDEFLIMHSPWAERWREHTLEAALYKTDVRGQKFWEEARYAETRGDTDALEALYLCVMLGFRGDWRNRPEQVEAWVARIRPLLDTTPARAETDATDWAFVVREAAAPTDLPYRRMLFTAMLTFSLLVPAALVIFWRHFGATS